MVSEREPLLLVSGEASATAVLRELFSRYAPIHHMHALAQLDEFLQRDDSKIAGAAFSGRLSDGAGIAALRRFRRVHPRKHAIVVLSELKPELVNAAAAYGAQVVALPLEDEAVVATFLRRCYPKATPSPRGQRLDRARLRAADAGLTKRETDVLLAFVDGQDREGVATELGLSKKTVDNHTASILRKTKQYRMSELIIELLIETQEPPTGKVPLAGPTPAYAVPKRED